MPHAAAARNRKRNLVGVDSRTAEPCTGHAAGKRAGVGRDHGNNGTLLRDGNVKYLVFNDPNWTPEPRPINLGGDEAAAERSAAPITADNPDLSLFRQGGKRFRFTAKPIPSSRPATASTITSACARRSESRRGTEPQTLHGAWHESLPGR